MTMSCAASVISAPAEMARLLTNAIVRKSVFKSASRISTAASSLPPKVSISTMTTSAAAAVAFSSPPRTRFASRLPTSLRATIRYAFAGAFWSAGDGACSATLSEPVEVAPSPRRLIARTTVSTISTGARLMEKAPYLQACMRPHIYLQVLDAYLLYPPKNRRTTLHVVSAGRMIKRWP